MKFFEKALINYDVSLAFIVLIVAVMTVYMAVRCFKRVSALTVLSFVIQLFMLTSGVLAVLNRVITIPAYEIFLILFGVVLPGIFLFLDYSGMKKRIRISNSDVPLIERLEKQSDKGWKYEDYIGQVDEYKSEIQAGVIVKNLNLEDKHIKTNITQQLSIVHKLIDNREYKQALEVYNLLSGLLSDNPMIVYNTAWLNYKNKLFEESVKLYKKALFLLGEEHEDKTKKKSGNTDRNISIRPQIHFGYAASLYAMGRYELAINQFNLSKNEAENERVADVNIARCYIAIGVVEEAQKHIKTALKTKEDNKLRYLLARLCFEKNEEMECKYQLEQIVSNDAEFTEAWSLLGRLYRKNGDWKNAQLAYKKLTQLIPQDADCHYRLGVAYREDGKTEEALSCFKFATELMPDHSRALYCMASVYDGEGRTDKAIECLEKSLNGNERLEMAYNLLAEIYISNDNIVEAIHIYEESTRAHPDSYLVHFNLGVTLMMMKRYEEAVREFKKAHRLTSDDPSLYYNWASAVIGLKNYSEAARLYKEGLKLKSDDDEILFGLARVSALSGDTDAVMGFLSRSFEVNPDLRLRAKTSHDFAAYRTVAEFMEITKLPIREEKKHA